MICVFQAAPGAWRERGRSWRWRLPQGLEGWRAASPARLPEGGARSSRKKTDVRAVFPAAPQNIAAVRRPAALLPADTATQLDPARPCVRDERTVSAGYESLICCVGGDPTLKTCVWTAVRLSPTSRLLCYFGKQNYKQTETVPLCEKSANSLQPRAFFEFVEGISGVCQSINPANISDGSHNLQDVSSYIQVERLNYFSVPLYISLSLCMIAYSRAAAVIDAPLQSGRYCCAAPVAGSAAILAAAFGILPNARV